MPRKTKLTDRDVAVYKAIIRYKIRYCGNSPTIRLIRNNANISSTSVVSYILRKLEKFGLLKLIKSKKRRSTTILLVGEKYTPPNSSILTIIETEMKGE